MALVVCKRGRIVSDHSPITCYKCGVLFYVPSRFREARLQDGENFWCPSGHRQAYTETETDRLRRERDRLKQSIAQKDDEITYQRDRRATAERSANAYKGQATKLRNRAKNGVCPCCNRSFQNLKDHMATKHPKFEGETS